MSEDGFISLAEPFLGENARRYVLDCLETNFVSSVGPYVDRFEREFAAYVGTAHAVACASGTAALHIAMRLIDLAPGDEVLVPTLTFIASANPILYERGTPVLVDSEARSWNLDPEPILTELSRRARAGARQPKALMLVHLLGRPADLAPLVAACDHHGIHLIEDAAEALGGHYTAGPFIGRQVGTIGRIGCFSFNGNKLITTGGGGMLVTDDAAFAKRAKHLTTQARLPGAAYWHDEVGYNYRLTNMAAALGVAQLEQLPDLLARKRLIAERYGAALAALPGVTLPAAVPGSTASHWLYSILVADQGLRDKLVTALAAERIQVRPIWTPLHRMPMYADCPRLGQDTADDLADRGLSLPCSAGLTAEQQQRVIQALYSRLAH
ncbi:MAG: aminotransferase class I/II-fold pyridoxal phosphate-dependent enzyme [Candidatus Sericytochromatia bacterium]|nr:aminotransferase class I/II-fold pyridoxal phosphate-dependent enzyme [Candidatus Sericytochromatia bacterium]